MYDFFITIVDFVESFGYIGIFIMTFLEGTFIPIPSEITMIPAGYLVAKSKMNVYAVLIISILGTIGGSLFNYYIGYRYGRSIFIKYGKYILLTPEKLSKIEKFFKEHGHISTFAGRILPGLKHFISFPAGLAKMDIKLFCLYTGSGGAIWLSILIAIGYLIGDNELLIKTYIKKANNILIVSSIVLVVFYIVFRKLKQRKKNGSTKNS